MQINTINTVIDSVRQTIIRKYQSKEPDLYMKTLEAAQVEEDEYFYYRISEDLRPIISDIRKAHIKDASTAPESTLAEDIRKGIEEAAAFTGSDQERQAKIFCMQLWINYDRLTTEEFAALVSILKKSKMLKSPLSKRRKTDQKKKKR